MTRLLAFYPRWWRDRYGDEMRGLLELAPARSSHRADLVRGALDAWLHPPAPSRLPALAALLGGALWTVVAAGVVAQPVPPDWPGYLIEVIPLALASVAYMLVALIGISLRAVDAGGRSIGLAVGLAVIVYLGWIVALGATVAGAVDGATLGALQAAAMAGSIAIGAVLVRTDDRLIGTLVLVAAVTMLIPWSAMWLAFGAAWTAIGIVLEWERRGRIRERRSAA